MVNRLLSWLVFLLLAFLGCRVDAATQAPFTGYKDGGNTYCYTATSTQLPYALSVPAAGAACQSYLNSLALAGCGGGTDTWTYTVGSPSYYACYDSVNTCGGTHACGSLGSSIASSSVCSPGFTYSTSIGLCSNVNTVAGTPTNPGDCAANQDQNMVIPGATPGGAPPLLVTYGGCQFELGVVHAAYQNGAMVWAGQYTSNGVISSSGTGGSSSANPATQPTLSACPGGNNIVMSSGSVTCLPPSELSPVIAASIGYSGTTAVVAVTDCASSNSCSSNLQNASGVIAGSYSSNVGTGPGGTAVSVSFPPGLAQDATVAGITAAVNTQGGLAQGLLSGIQASLLASASAVTGVSDPTSTASGTIAGAFLDSSFSGIVGWVLPARAVACPTWTIDLSSYQPSWVFTMDGQCTLWASGSTAATVQAIALVAWAIIAMIIVLGA